MSGVDLAERMSSVRLSGVSSVGLAILSVGVGRHWFWFECQCRLGKKSQCLVSEILPSWALFIECATGPNIANILLLQELPIPCNDGSLLTCGIGYTLSNPLAQATFFYLKVQNFWLRLYMYTISFVFIECATGPNIANIVLLRELPISCNEGTLLTCGTGYTLSNPLAQATCQSGNRWTYNTREPTCNRMYKIMILILIKIQNLIMIIFIHQHDFGIMVEVL